MRIRNSTVFVTGAGRGIGLAFTREALARGASKVYAGVRNPGAFSEHGMVPVRIGQSRMAERERARDGGCSEGRVRCEGRSGAYECGVADDFAASHGVAGGMSETLRQLAECQKSIVGGTRSGP